MHFILLLSQSGFFASESEGMCVKETSEGSLCMHEVWERMWKMKRLKSNDSLGD